MKLSVKGGTARQRSLCRRLIPFLEGKLLQFQFAHELSLTIEFKEDTEGDAGNVIFDEDMSPPVDFIMVVNKLIPLQDIALTICHEMVHIKQFAKGEYRIKDSGKDFILNWKDHKKNYNKTAYLKQPWEIEAFSMQDKLFGEYLISLL